MSSFKVPSGKSMKALPMNLCAQVARINNKCARELLVLMTLLPESTANPPVMQESTYARVRTLLEEEFRERVGIDRWIQLRRAGLLASSTTSYVRFLCQRIEFDEAAASEGAEDSNDRVKRIADELEVQLTPYVYDSEDDSEDDSGDELDSSDGEDSGISDQDEQDNEEDGESGQGEAPEAAQHVCKRARLDERK